LHRRESWGSGILEVTKALKEISIKYQGINIVIATHPNALVQDMIHEELDEISNILILSHLPYIASLYHIKHSFLVLTDSGGIQEEASFFKIPTLVARNKTERTEGLDAGCSILVGTNKELIVDSVVRLLSESDLYDSMSSVICPYGDGFASEKIVSVLNGQGSED
jgi:UDP-N-acetylglucosamine 2-epimerase (non-hydrolysing)